MATGRRRRSRRRNIAARGEAGYARYLPSPALARALYGLSRARRYAALWEIAYTANKEIARRDKEPERVTLPAGLRRTEPL